MDLEKFGFSPELEKQRKDNGLSRSAIGKVTVVYKDRYIVATTSGEMNVALAGDLRNSIISDIDYPSVGDWVTLKVFTYKWAIIVGVVLRKNLLKRKAIGISANKQPIAANIDGAFLVQSVGLDYSLSRLEPYLEICFSEQIQPVIVLSKIDQIDALKLSGIVEEVKKRHSKIPIIGISNTTLVGIDKIHDLIEKGKTYCLLGSSGAGKSTLINTLIGEKPKETGNFTISSHLGKQLTIRRQLIVLKNGGLLINSSEMNEVGIGVTDQATQQNFEIIDKLSKYCRTEGCKHVNEEGCAVMNAVENNELDISLYENFIKSRTEKESFETDNPKMPNKDKGNRNMNKDYKKSNNG